MKDLTTYINESLSEDKNIMPLLGLLDDIDIDFSQVTGKDDYDLAKNQEQLLADELKKVAEEYEILTIKEYCEKKKITYSPEVDSKIGDIIIYKEGKIAFCIDLKVSKSQTTVGTPTMLSLINFQGNTKHYYVCSNINGTNIRVLSANNLYNYITSGKGEVKVSKKRKESFSKVNALLDKVNLTGTGDLEKLYNEDFVTTNTIKELTRQQ